MSLYVLDTDIISLLQDGDPAVSNRVAQCPPSQLAISVISVEEQLSGWYRRLRQAKQPEQLARAYERLAVSVRTLSRLPILTFSVPAIHRYRLVQKQVRNVRKMDLRIAAIALEHNAVVVTRNLGDFRRIPGLAIEDWSQ
jgi:tRNA(fMet)-specific endonuclease VapC